jgi:lauroyl/myristoyl acyltransferase
MAVTHLSRPFHGLSRSRLGAKVLNPIQLAAENRYLAERIVVPLSGSLAYARLLERRLRDNRIVTIRCGDEGSRTTEVPFLGRRLRLATGPLSLALRTEAALLPVFTIQRPDRSFEVIVESPIERVRPHERRAVVEELARSYGTLLESYVLRHPVLWHDWHRLGADSTREPART